jgi:hypothetical protein
LEAHEGHEGHEARTDATDLVGQRQWSRRLWRRLVRTPEAVRGRWLRLSGMASLSPEVLSQRPPDIVAGVRR